MGRGDCDRRSGRSIPFATRAEIAPRVGWPSPYRRSEGAGTAEEGIPPAVATASNTRPRRTRRTVSVTPCSQMTSAGLADSPSRRVSHAESVQNGPEQANHDGQRLGDPHGDRVIPDDPRRTPLG
jgi:hypothetical protein